MLTPHPKSFDRFDLDLGRAVLEQLIERFELLVVGRLDMATINRVFSEQGVYQLFIGNLLVYTGKTSKALPKRLQRHLRLLLGRQNITPADLGFKAVVIHRNWMPSIHEGMIIEHYTKKGYCSWNLTGFGNNDPGRRREDTVKNDFDRNHPIRTDLVCDFLEVREWNALELLVTLKKQLPFLFRYQCDPKTSYTKGSKEYNQIAVRLLRADMPLHDLLQLVIDQFPPGWQATIFPSHAILYKERRDYEHSTLVIRNQTGLPVADAGQTVAE